MAVDLRTDLSGAVWRKSSRSQPQGEECVEVAGNLPQVVAVRDSKDPGGPELVVGRSAFGRLVGEIRSGSHDL